MDRDSGVARGTNRLLDALPAADRERLLRLLRPTFIDAREVLFEPHETILMVHFPLNCVISLVTPLDGGAGVEVASVGNEGVVSVPLTRGSSLAVRGICAVAGSTLRMDTSTFLDETERSGPLRAILDDYLLALFGQISQAAACNRLHTTEERLSRWLLLSYDRVGTNTFPITHEFLASVMGVRRATVTLSAETLQAAGLIRYRRGQVTIVDRAGLEAIACECYQVIGSQLDGVVERARRRSQGHVARPG
jgi:CRP-like cAMP-binding protein